jgi:hypothetical protein
MGEVRRIDLRVCLGTRCDTLNFSTTPTDKYGSLAVPGVFVQHNGDIFVNLNAIDLDVHASDEVTVTVTAKGRAGRAVAEADEQFRFDADDGGGCHSTRLTHNTVLSASES